ncbi:MAG: hypothetical protein RR949_01585 [Oscillospiraceae bacterium]
MTHIVKGYTISRINLSPASVVEEVLQNVAIIITTPQFSVPLDRGFGTAQRYLDMPEPAAKTVMAADIIEAIGRYEPRAEIANISFEVDTGTPGRLVPVLEVNILDE